ncbi:MAG: acyltransferase family protein [Candidatus Nanopelagicales bacterium]
MTTVDLRERSRASARPLAEPPVRRHLARERHAAPPRVEQSPASFRADVEGLRAVAILVVVLFHAGIGALPGGFVGVDVFFVLSGFLITGLIVREMQSTGTVSVARFYGRRAKRLLPATALVLAVVAAVSTVLVSVVDRGSVGLDVVAAATYVANWRFGLGAVDYFAAGIPSPVLHFWSLAVEEQFYLVWPWLLLLVTRGARRHGRSLTPALLVGLAVVAVPSLWWSSVQTESSPGWAYFSTFTRAWELAVGGALVMVLPMLARMPRVVAALLGWVGAVAVVWSVLTYSEAMAFPGTAALVPVLGTAALVAAGSRLPDAGASRLLSHPLLVRVGGVSYSWYLWHWPLLVFAAILVGGELSWWQALPVVAVSYVVAVVTRRVVEEPFHHSRVLSLYPDRALRLGAVCTAVGIVAGLALAVPAALADRSPVDADAAPGAAALAVQAKPDVFATASPAAPAPAPGFVPAVTKLRDDLPPTYADGCHQRYDGTAVPECVYGDPKGDRTVVLFGDSHAATWFPALRTLAQQQGWRLVSLTKNACPVAATRVYAEVLDRSYRECATWRAAAMLRIAQEKPDLVVTAGRTDYQVMRSGTRLGADESVQPFTNALTRAYRQLDAVAGSVVALRDNPMLTVDPVECLARNLDDPSACTRRLDQTVPEPDVEQRAAEAGGATFLDTRPVFCPDGTCPAVIGGVAVYRDVQHIGATYSRTLAPFLAPVLEQQLR